MQLATEGTRKQGYNEGKWNFVCSQIQVSTFLSNPKTELQLESHVLFFYHSELKKKSKVKRSPYILHNLYYEKATYGERSINPQLYLKIYFGLG